MSSTFKPYGIANIITFIAMILFLIFQPKVNEPSTHWALVMVGILLLLAIVFVVKGTLRLKQIKKSAMEDRRRLATGLPVDPEDSET
jgi:amino acid transporter